MSGAGCALVQCQQFADLAEYFNNPTYSDVRLYTKERKLHVNSVVLSLHSPVFKRIISEEEEKDIFLESFLEEEDEMEMVVSSLYNRTLLRVDCTLLFTVLKFSLTYQISWMTDICVSFVKENLSQTTCIPFTQTGHKMREFFRHEVVLADCCRFAESTQYLEEMVVSLEMLEDPLLTSLPLSFLSALLLNNLRRDERRMVELVRRWSGTGRNVIQTMELVPLLQLSQLFLVNKELHSDFFQFLVSSDKLTPQDRKLILEVSNKSIADSSGAIVTGVGFSKVLPKDTDTKSITDFLRSDTWTTCSFDDVVMVKQYSGVTEQVYLELFLAWSRHNPTTEYQINTILAAVDLHKVNPEYLQDVLVHIRHPGNYPDTIGAQLEARIGAHNYPATPGSVREFTNQTLTAGNVKAIKLKKHTLTTRPCTVSFCRQRSLAYVDVKLKRDGKIPWYKVGKLHVPATMLDHCHNKHVSHVYFVVDKQILSCYTEKWEYLEEQLTPDTSTVVIKVLCSDAAM